MKQDYSINLLPRTSSITKRRFESLGIKTFFDLLCYFPTRYNNYSLVSPIASLQLGEIATIKGQIISSKNVYARRGIIFQKIQIRDSQGDIIESTWFNQPYIVRLLKPGLTVALAGTLKPVGKQMTFESTEYEVLNDLSQETIHTGRIVPIYSEKRSLSSRTIRDKIYRILKETIIDEPFPEQFLKKYDLADENLSFREIHFPSSLEHISKAKSRLSFDELFYLELSNSLIKDEWLKRTATTAFIHTEETKNAVKDFIKALPYKLTNAQEKAVREIEGDLMKTFPMNRFLQGDVGSGKTVVAALAAYFCQLNGYQTVFMAPTEILAFQHYETISKLFGGTKLKIALLTNSKKTDKQTDLSQYDIIVGTQSVLSEKIKYERVGLIIIDEQHRFGVAQRSLLKKKGQNPHLLTMTATPIPRTVALLMYGELSLSVLDEMPHGRLPVKTFLVPEIKKNDCYQWIRKKIKDEHEQIFVVCPLIDESEAETMKTVKAAEAEYLNLKNSVFPDLSVGMLHGRLKSPEKESVMNDYKNKKYDLLVTTSVVEVGIDIPDATVMIIEGADRFGLAQLHQLRGRVGRRNKQSYCFLFTDKKDDYVISRLNFFCKTQKGMDLAEYDLKRRGPGEIFGQKQHGYLNLKIADLGDIFLIKKVKEAVTWYKEQNFPIDKTRLPEVSVSRD